MGHRRLNFLRKFMRSANRVNFVIAGDMLAAIVAAPLAVILGHINLPSYEQAFLSWLIMIIVMTIVFPRYRLYSSLWRFASSSDFLNIAKAVLVTTVCAFAINWALIRLGVLPNIDGRIFILFGLVLAIFVSLSRILYRSLSDRFALSKSFAGKSQKKTAVFIGTISEASLAMRQLSSNSGKLPHLRAIISMDKSEPDGQYLSGIVIRRDLSKLTELIADSKNGAIPLTHAIIGTNGFANDDERIETIRKARAAGMTVMVFRGVENVAAAATGRILREVDVLSMLNRKQHKPDEKELAGVVESKRVIVTGGAGSIGSQLARQCLSLGAAQVIVVDRSETAVFHWMKNLPKKLRANAVIRVADISSEPIMARIFREFKPDVVFHAAALKHVPLVETNWTSAINTNVLGAWTCAKLAEKFNVERFVFISTDKAVEPTTFLGQTKRFGELMCGALNQRNASNDIDKAKPTRFTAVRFGNVFGTEGSVVNVFEDQIKSGGPLTITHPDMRRYFMTAKEASGLVIQSALMDAETSSNTSQIYVLEMGDQIKIIDIAGAMIRLAGKNPGVDIEIKVTGIRQHEKLEEKLVSTNETVLKTANNNILIAKCPELSVNVIEEAVSHLVNLTIDGDYKDAFDTLANIEASAAIDDTDSRVIKLNVNKRQKP